MSKDNHFFAYVFRMKFIRRWGLMKNSRDENLEEHSLEAAVIAHSLAVIRRDIFGRDCDPEKIAAAAMFHDASEILTGDMPTPVKYMSKEITGAYKSIENNADEKLLGFLPDELRPAYTALFAFNHDPQAYPLIKAADRLTAYIKCLEEIKSGNGEFRKAAEQTLAAINAMELPEAGYFIEHFLPSFKLTLDELE